MLRKWEVGDGRIGLDRHETVLEWLETSHGTMSNVLSEKDSVHIGRRG